MNLSPSDFHEAAAESISHDREIVNFEVTSAIETGNLKQVWDLVPRFALLDMATFGEILGRLKMKFGAHLCSKYLEGAINLERAKVKRPNASVIRGGMIDVQVNGIPMRDITTNSMRALVTTNDPPFLFIRSAEFCYVGTDERDRPAIVPVDADHLRGRLDRCCNYVKITLASSVSVFPPMDIVRDILALPPNDWALPALDVVVEIPTMRPDGTVLDVPGYDAQSRVMYQPAADLEMRPIPTDPTTDEITEAVELVDDILADFPFTGPSDKANFIALLLTPIVRPAISGCTPLALVDAPQAGTGKSLLADVLAVIATGRQAAFLNMPRSEEEIQKSILANLMGGRCLVVYDNVEGVLASPALAMALTASVFEGRILGHSKNQIVSNKSTWLATGNNIRPAGDMPRRCYHIRIDAQSSQPYLGRVFRHKELLEYVAKNRAELLRALLIMARAWWSQGCRQVVTDPLGSFAGWHCAIGGILATARVPGFLANMSAWLSEADENAIQWEHFLSELLRYHEDRWFTPAKIGVLMRGNQPPFTLPDSLADVDMRVGRGLERAVGRSFAKRLGQRFGKSGLHLEKRVGVHAGGSEYRVVGG